MGSDPPIAADLHRGRLTVDMTAVATDSAIWVARPLPSHLSDRPHNRGLCQHSGFCTDRLSSVFRAGEEPFVTPSGGRMDEIAPSPAMRSW
jgi:hypothetical protein